MKASLEKLLQAAEELKSVLDNCQISSGDCCCGEDMLNHSAARCSGHRPTDRGEYYGGLALQGLSRAIDDAHLALGAPHVNNTNADPSTPPRAGATPSA